MEPSDKTVKPGADAAAQDVQQPRPVDLPKRRSSPRRYTTTAKKLAANRKNAKRSTGPRTDAGKLAVRLNPLTHGILAKEVIDSARILGESPEQYESLLAGLVESLKPVGTAEELAVQDIAVTFIRRARALRAETAEIENAQREADVMEYMASLRLDGLALQFIPGSSSAVIDMFRSAEQVQNFTTLVAKALQLLDSDPSNHTVLQDLDERLDMGLVGRATAPDGNLRKFLAEIQSKLKAAAVFIEENRKLRRQCACLPPPAVIERIVRYASMLERELMRAVQWLRMLQEARRLAEQQEAENAKQTQIR